MHRRGRALTSFPGPVTTSFPGPVTTSLETIPICNFAHKPHKKRPVELRRLDLLIYTKRAERKTELFYHLNSPFFRKRHAGLHATGGRMYGTSGAIQAQEYANTWLPDSPATPSSGKLLREKPDGYGSGNPGKWGTPLTNRSPYRLSKAWWWAVVFFVLLTLLPIICLNSAGALINKGLDSRRLAGSDAPDEHFPLTSDSDDLTKLCNELGPWSPAPQLPGNPRASPAIVEEALLALEEDSTSEAVQPSSTAATFPPYNKAQRTPQPYFAPPERQLERNVEGERFVRSTWEEATREAQSLAEEAYSLWQFDPILQKHSANLQHAQLHPSPLPVQPASDLFADSSPCVVRRPLIGSYMAVSNAPASYEQLPAPTQATTSPGGVGLYEVTPLFRHAQLPPATVGVQHSANLLAYSSPCAVRKPLGGTPGPSSYASTSRERPSSSSGSAAVPAVSHVREGSPYIRSAQLHPAPIQAQPTSSLFANSPPCALRQPWTEGTLSSSGGPTSQERLSSTPEESDIPTESDRRPSNHEFKHPFVRLPSVEPGVVPRPFMVPDTKSMKCGPRRQVVVLRKIRQLLLKDKLNQRDANRLILLAEGAANQMLFAMTSEIPTKKPYLASEYLGRRFLTISALYCISKVLKLDWEKQVWWKELLGRIPSEYRSHVYVTPGEVPDSNIRLATDLAAAINLYKLGLSPSEEDVIALKQRLFCKPNSPYSLRAGCWKPWRDDEDSWQKSSRDNGANQ